jgi:putative hydrolases of HD superfamily
METINKIRKFYHLKNVDRAGPVGERRESAAEHSWSCLILADYFLNLIQDKDIDRLKVYELLIYHDVVEIETGDIPIHHEEERKNKQQDELKALELIKEEIPQNLKDKFVKLFTEFEDCETKEAKLAKAIDALDAMIHFLDYKESWKGWTEEMVRKFHGSKMGSFKETQEVFEKIVEYAKGQGFFEQ